MILIVDLLFLLNCKVMYVWIVVSFGLVSIWNFIDIFLIKIR